MMSPARAASSDVKVQSFGNTQRSSNSTPAKGSFESLYAPSTARVRQTCTCKSSDGSSRHCTKEGCPRRRNLAGFRTPMALNYDILLVLMDLLERKTLLSLMQTSRMLYDAGIHQILSKPVTLGRRFKLRSFCSFMLVDYPSRLRHLRNVSIEKGFRPECGCLDTLCTLLSDAPHLETLEIARCDQFLQCNPELADAIASNPNIKSLRLDMAGDEGLAFLRRVRCPLTSAAVLLTPPCLTGFPDMAMEMSKFNSTLKDLSIQHSGILATKISSYRYPLVTSLTVEESDVRLPALAHMFPALRELTVYSFAYNIAQSDEEVEAIRKESKAWQVEAGMGWHHLDKLEGDVTSLYGLAPICKVDLVSGMLTSRNITRFAEVCRDTRPSTLKLYFHMDKCSVGELKDVLHASPDFRSLSITVDAIGLTQDLDFTKFFNDLRSVVGTTPVNTLYFRFTWHSGSELLLAEMDNFSDLDSDDEDESGDEEDGNAEKEEEEEAVGGNEELPISRPGTPEPVKEYLLSLTIDMVVQRCATFIPTLRHACFDMPMNPLSYWEISRHDDGTFSYIQLPNVVGESIMAKML